MASRYLTSTNAVSINQKFRSKRFKFFMDLLQSVKPEGPWKILDVGGREVYWERMGTVNDDRMQITLLNLEEVPTKYKNVTSIKGDACDLSRYKDGEFDIVYSNSVIEHLYSVENQKKMADEARRVGKYYYIQTPNFYFPIEPHWLIPIFHWLPFKTRVFLTKHFNLGHFKKEPDQEKAVDRVQSVILTTEKKMKKMFPDAKVYREYFLGLKNLLQCIALLNSQILSKQKSTLFSAAQTPD